MSQELIRDVTKDILNPISAFYIVVLSGDKK